MERFLQLHVLTAYPPSNLNRDMLGRPKTAVIGNTQRLRISSQSLKRAWRKSEVFSEQLAGNIGSRTRNLVEVLKDDLVVNGTSEKESMKIAKEVAEIFGKVEQEKEDADSEGKQLFFFTQGEIDLAKMVAKRMAGGEKTAISELQNFARRSTAADIALFGRMLAEKEAQGKWNVEAACQVAHAFTVQKVTIEEDDFTAVDDLSGGDTGAGHMGVSEFASGLFYIYVCIDRSLLLTNLNGDAALLRATVAALTEAIVTVSPSGKQNSFGSRAFASYVLSEKGKHQPRSLSVAYLSALGNTEALLSTAVTSLESTKQKMDAAFWGEGEKSYVLNVNEGKGKLSGLIDFVQD